MSEADHPPPPLVANVLWGWDYASEHWQSLMRLPVFILVVIVGVGAYYFGANKNAETISVKDERIGVKDERIAFLNDQVSAYKDRLQGATPDQAAKEIA